MTEEFRENRYCFVCGEDNPVGLKLKFRMDEEEGEAATDVTFEGRFQGWDKIVHGGLLATVLDEAMIYASRAKGLRCVTGEITVRYRTPVKTGVTLHIQGRFVEDKGRIVLAESEALDPGGVSVARASAKLFKI